VSRPADLFALKPISAAKMRANLEADRNLYADQLALARKVADALKPLDGKDITKRFATNIINAIPALDCGVVHYNQCDYGGDATVQIRLKGEAYDSYRNIKMQLGPAGSPFSHAYFTALDSTVDGFGRKRYAPNASFWLNESRIASIERLLKTDRIERAVEDFNHGAECLAAAQAVLQPEDISGGHSAHYLLSPEHEEVRA
jgi:hypothetical protein